MNNNNKHHSITSQPSDTAWGIDTVTLSFDVDLSLCDIDSPLWMGRSTKKLSEIAQDVDTFTGLLPSEHANVRVALYTLRSVCSIHFNAARLAFGKSEELLHPDALEPMAEGILNALQGTVWPAFDRVSDNGDVIRDANWADQVRVSRLDPARNFLISHPEAIKSGLRSIRSKNMKTQVEYINSEGGWTLENRTKSSGSDRIYDKGSELDSQQVNERLWSDEKLYRFESQLQGDRLVTLGLKHLSKVNSASAWNALDARWTATGWGQPLPGNSGLLQAVAHLSHTRQDNLLGYLHRRAEGVLESMPAHYRRERDKLAISLGLIPGLPLDSLGASETRLDIFMGTEVSMSQETEAA